MAPNVVHLPNGHNLTVMPVFGGLYFKSNELNIHNSIFPAGWTVILHSEDYLDEHEEDEPARSVDGAGLHKRQHHIHRFKQPTLQGDHLFISSISNVSTSEFKAPASPTRQIAMMLWATAYWYFHQPAPSLHVMTDASKETPEAGRPKADWRLNIKREGVFRGRHLLQKLERMGLITGEDSSVGSTVDDRSAEGWTEMFISRRSFWQLPAKLFLFTLAPVSGSSFPGSPYGSRPSSPVRNSETPRSRSPHIHDTTDPSTRVSPGLWVPQTPGPFASGSHLPTYFPPPPPQYTMTNGIRHPIRPKAPRQGETFYTRFIPSVGQYLSFRVASLNDRAVAYRGPVSTGEFLPSLSTVLAHIAPAAKSGDIPTIVQPGTGTQTSSIEADTAMLSDVQLLHKWMNDPRVSAFWGCSGPVSKQEAFLKTNLESRHSFPAIGSWDGKPFGYFEIYWVKEDILGRHLNSGEVEDWDRGVHVLVGEQPFRGKQRVRCWLTSLVHWAFVTDYRTNALVLEPRVDNERFIEHLKDAGFSKEKEVAFAHKQSAFMRLKRETFDAPFL